SRQRQQRHHRFSDLRLGAPQPAPDLVRPYRRAPPALRGGPAGGGGGAAFLWVGRTRAWGWAWGGWGPRAGGGDASSGALRRLLAGRRFGPHRGQDLADVHVGAWARHRGFRQREHSDVRHVSWDEARRNRPQGPRDRRIFRAWRISRPTGANLLGRHDDA